ncbi:Erg28-like protein [Syncephalis plumigaleata]|nr:Erg28-like protein [Syncephalis plumigaleata]
MFGWLPSLQHGLLPAWMFLVSVTAFGNSAQCFITGRQVSARVYNEQPAEVSALASRFFAAWTAASAVIRLYTAYHIQNGALYDIAYWSYIIAFLHYGSEIFYYRTARIRGPAFAPCVVSTTSLIWMTLMRSHYVTSA